MVTKWSRNPKPLPKNRGPRGLHYVASAQGCSSYFDSWWLDLYLRWTWVHTDEWMVQKFQAVEELFTVSATYFSREFCGRTSHILFIIWLKVAASVIWYLVAIPHVEELCSLYTSEWKDWAYDLHFKHSNVLMFIFFFYVLLSYSCHSSNSRTQCTVNNLFDQ